MTRELLSVPFNLIGEHTINTVIVVAAAAGALVVVVVVYATVYTNACCVLHFN